MARAKIVHIRKNQEAGEILVARIEELRAQRQIINEQLAEAEAALLKIVGGLPAEGTVHKIIGTRKVKIETRLRRNLDQRKVREALQNLPEHVAKRVFPVQYKLSLRELRYVEENEPEYFGAIRRTFTTAHAKPTITIEE